MSKKSIGIIGGGIVGMTTAYQINKMDSQCRIYIIEKEGSLAKHQTSNNSGVIHSGIYYKPGSLKAKNCLRGYHQLLEFCTQLKIDYELCGKLIVATLPEEIPLLQNLYNRGMEHGLEGLKWLESNQIREFEPHCAGINAIFVPQTGIVNYRNVVDALQEQLVKNSNVEIKLNSEVVGFETINHPQRNSKEINSKEGQACKIRIRLKNKETVEVDQVVNCAGLHCDKIAELAGEKLDVRIIPFRGEYYKLSRQKSHLVKNLIYPVPDPDFPFLGVHFTRRISGEIEAGPNAVFAFKREGYKKTDFSASDFMSSLFWPGFQKVMLRYWKTGLAEFYRSFSKSAFTHALQKLVPEIQKGDLIPAGSGVRAQACDRKGNLIDDFYIQKTDSFVHVLNAPSPAATSSFSIGLQVAEWVLGKRTEN